MNKIGNVLDWFWIMVIVLMVVLITIATYIIVGKVKAVDIFQETPEASNAIQITENTLLNMDSMVLFIIVGLSLYVIVSSALIWNHPAFFIVGFLLLSIAITVAAVMSNAFWSFIQVGEIAANVGAFPKIQFLMEKFPFYILFMGIFATVAGYVGYQNRQ